MLVFLNKILKKIIQISIYLYNLKEIQKKSIIQENLLILKLFKVDIGL